MAVFALPASAHVHLTPAGFTGRRGQAVACQVDILPLQGNFSALTCKAVSQQSARLTHHPAVAAVQDNLPPAALQPFRLDGAAVVHHRVHQHVPTLRRQVHLPVGGRYQSTILHQSTYYAAVHQHRRQTAVIQLQGDRFACRQHRFPRRGGYCTAVADALTGEHDIPTLCGGQAALVDDLRARITAAAERVLPLHKVCGVNVLRGSHQTRDVHPRILPEQHPVGIENKDLSIGFQGTHNLRTTGPGDTVERNRTAVGLNELYGVVFTDIKAVPVGGQILRLLMNSHLIAVAADTALPPHNLPTGRQVWISQCHQRQHPHHHAG